MIIKNRLYIHKKKNKEYGARPITKQFRMRLKKIIER